MFLPLLVITTCVGQLTRGHLILSDKDYELLPTIYKINGHEECLEKNNNYFRVDIKLNPLNRNDTVWKLIEGTRKEKFVYNHDEIYRVLCVPKVYERNPQDLQNFVTNIVREEVLQFNLTPTVTKIIPKDLHVPSSLDYFLLFVLIGYICLIFGATYYDVSKRNQSQSSEESMLTAFSLRYNYENIFSVHKGSHYQNLKCMQGLRTIACILVIWAHTKMSLMNSFVENTKYIEDLFYEIFYVHYVFDAFVTQVFSLISAWLLTVQVLSVFEANKVFTIKDALFIFIYRISRLWPVLFFLVICHRKAFVDLVIQAPLMDVIDTSVRGCEKYWWYSLLFIQNIKIGHGCNEGYWFVSTDMQLYSGGLLLLYVALKFQSIRKVLGISLLLSCGLFGLIIYLHNLEDPILRASPEELKWHNFVKSINVFYLHKLPYATMATYILGICFGMYYYKHHKSENKKIASPFWILSFLGFPTLAIVIASKECFNGFSAALIGPLLKPMYSFGIGMGILGMSQSANGIMKKIFECRPLEFLSQFTYSIYMSHFLTLFLRNGLHKPLEISNFILITSGITDILSGFMVGFIVYLIVEQPCNNILKIYLSQVKKRSKKVE